MKNTNEYTQEILRRGNEKLVRERRKRNQRIAVTLCMCLVICLGAGGAFALPKLINKASENSSSSHVTESSSVVQNNADNGNTAGTDDLPFFSGADVPDSEVTTDDRPVIWGDNTSVEDYGICEWNGINITSRLYDKLEENDENVLFAVTPMNFLLDMDFVYNGKTLSQYEADREDEYSTFNKLGMLLKDGDSLKYGELLYKGGAPSGEKWAESFYHERVEMYGEEFLAKYIVNGEFLKDKVQEDLDAMSDRTASKLHDEAVEAYRLYTIKELAKTLDEQDIRYEMMNDYLVMYVTENELAQLSSILPSQSHFGLAVDFNQPQDFENYITDDTDK